MHAVSQGINQQSGCLLPRPFAWLRLKGTTLLLLAMEQDSTRGRAVALLQIRLAIFCRWLRCIQWRLPLNGKKQSPAVKFYGSQDLKPCCAANSCCKDSENAILE